LSINTVSKDSGYLYLGYDSYKLSAVTVKSFHWQGYDSVVAVDRQYFKKLSLIKSPVYTE